MTSMNNKVSTFFTSTSNHTKHAAIAGCISGAHKNITTFINQVALTETNTKGAIDTHRIMRHNTIHFE